MPALPLDEAGKYVAGAYVVFLALVLIYVAIMATKIDRMRRELTDLADLAERQTVQGASVGASDNVAVGTAQGGQGVGATPRGSGREAEQPREGLSSHG